MEHTEALPDIAPFRKRFEEIDVRMAAPDFFQDSRHAAKLSREHQKLHCLLESYQQLEKLQADMIEYRAIVNDPEGDPELRELAREELPVIEAQFNKSREQVLIAMMPPEMADSRNTVVEIRAGTGGDEASLFAADLFRMYSRFAENRSWKLERLSANPSECGGFKEVICLISGDNVYKFLKFESGVHRVQRIPVTEANGRIHTSTATVAVLSEAEEVDIHIDPNDLEISVSRASGPGGQSVNTTDSAVQVMHRPTGITAYCADERSQLKNKQKALKVLRARLLKLKEEEERAKYDADRRSQVGRGERSERIRTYNFPQSRLTDHRIGLTLYSLPQVMEGQIDDVIEALQRAEGEAKLKDMLEAIVEN